MLACKNTFNMWLFYSDPVARHRTVVLKRMYSWSKERPEPKNTWSSEKVHKSSNKCTCAKTFFQNSATKQKTRNSEKHAYAQEILQKSTNTKKERGASGHGTGRKTCQKAKRAHAKKYAGKRTWSSRANWQKQPGASSGAEKKMCQFAKKTWSSEKTKKKVRMRRKNTKHPNTVEKLKNKGVNGQKQPGTVKKGRMCRKNNNTQIRRKTWSSEKR
jgi:hypothetical protein